MSIGLLTLEVHLPYAHSLKEKRMVVQRMKDRLRGRFNVAVAELDHQDTWQRLLLGVVSVSSSEENLRQVLDAALRESERILMDGGHSLVHSTIELL